MQQHSSSTCIWSIYLSVDTLLQSIGSYQDFLDIGLLLKTKLLNQRFHFVNSKSSLRKSYGRICNQTNMMGITSGAGTPYPSRAPEFTQDFQRGSCYSIVSFICMFCRHLFVLFVLFLLAIVLSVLLRYMNFHYPFDIFKLFLANFVYLSFVCLVLKDFIIILHSSLLTLSISHED